jgi:hypothetical protein
MQMQKQMQKQKQWRRRRSLLPHFLFPGLVHR